MTKLLSKYEGDGEYLSMHHPDDPYAEDDAPDATALALFATSGGMDERYSFYIKGTKMTDAGLIAIKAIGGGTLTSAERDRLTPSLLATLANGGHLALTREERARLSPELLGDLAIGGVIKLTREERNRFPAELLVQLAIGKAVELEADEFKRLPPHLRQLFG
jgi:hypothetical protein